MKLNEVVLTELEKLLKKYKIRNYTIREDGLVDVNGGVNISRGKFSKIPIKFGKITDYFNCSYNKYLTSLEDAPQEVGGSFICEVCDNLTSLEGCPQEIGRNFDCYMCHKLLSLVGGPTKVGGSYNCGVCIKLTNLKGCPQEINGDFNCHSNDKLISLEYGPQIVHGDYNCYDCRNLTSLKYLPKRLTSSLNVRMTSKVKDYLSIFKIEGITDFRTDNAVIEKIINKYLPKRDMLNCQDELIEAGFEEYAEVD